MTTAKKKIGIIGGTGYTAMELIRLLLNHPKVNIQFISTRKNEGELLKEYYPQLTNKTNLIFNKIDYDKVKQCDLIFLALPHGASMEIVNQLANSSVKIIDLSADFRIQNIQDFEQFYQTKHKSQAILKHFIYGLSEVYPQQIKKAQYIANPGCYPTSILLALIPLMQKGIVQINSQIFIDAKSGISGAGKSAKATSLMSEVAENISAYAVDGKHRHTAEINEQLNLYGLKQNHIQTVFIPHLIPMIRGMLSTIYLKTNASLEEVENIYQKFYEKSYFFQLIQSNQSPKTKNVRVSNHFQISVQKINSDTLMVLSAIDNLVKGASGQAIQNMNLMFGFEEHTALEQIASGI